MAKEVDLLSYWMPVLRELKEFKEISKAEEPEIKLLLEKVDRTLNNMFIETADEEGISHYESMLGITPSIEDTLETRRFNVLVGWNNNTIYTDTTLKALLTSLCGGEDRYNLVEDYENYKLDIATTVSVAGAYELVSKALADMLPCNLVLILSNTIESFINTSLNVGIATNTVMSYQIVHE